MITIYTCLRGREGLTRHEFQQHWEVVSARRWSQVPGLIGYEQFRIVMSTNETRGGLPHFGGELYDGIAAAWFASASDATAAIKSEAVGLVDADHEIFVDSARSTIVGAVDRTFFDPGDSELVTLGCLRRPVLIDRPTFSHRWIEHLEMAARVHDRGLLTGYVQSHVTADADAAAGRWRERFGFDGDIEDWDGIIRGYWPSIASMKYRKSMPEWEAACAADEMRFLDHSRTVSHVAERLTVIVLSGD